MSIGALMAGMLRGYTGVHERDEERKYREEQEEKRLTLQSKMHLLDTLGDVMTPEQQGQVIMSALQGYGVKGKQLDQIREMLQSMPKGQPMQTQVSGQMEQAPQMTEVGPAQQPTAPGMELPLTRTMAPTPSLQKPQLPTSVMGPVPNLTVGQIKAEQELGIMRQQEETLEQMKSQREEAERNKLIQQAQKVFRKYDIKNFSDLENKPDAAFELSLLNPKLYQELKYLMPGAGGALKSSMTPRKFWIPQPDGTNKEMYLRPTNRGTYVDDNTGQEINLPDGAVLDTGTAQLRQTMVMNPLNGQMEPRWTTIDVPTETSRMRALGKTVGQTSLVPPSPSRDTGAVPSEVDAYATIPRQTRSIEDLNKIPSKVRGKVAALLNDEGIQWEHELTPTGQKTLDEINKALVPINRAQSLVRNLAPQMAGKRLGFNRLKYWAGMYDPNTSDLINNLELARISAAQPYMGRTRAMRYVDMVMVHLPNTWVDDFDLITHKLNNVNDTVRTMHWMTRQTDVKGKVGSKERPLPPGLVVTQDDNAFVRTASGGIKEIKNLDEAYQELEAYVDSHGGQMPEPLWSSDVAQMRGGQGKRVPISVNAYIEQRNKRTGEYRYSTDGGKTWQKGRAPRQ